MSDEDRLTPWLWLDILNDYMSLPRGTCWVDHLLFYPPPDGHELRPISETYSWQSLKGYKRERNQKRLDDPRRDFLTNVFIAHIKEKRWQLEWGGAEIEPRSFGHR